MRTLKSSLLVTIIFFIFTEAVQLIEELSIGKNGKIYSENGAIEYFHLIGVPTPPEVLSNKIILTPPSPGNSRGALWSDKTLNNTYWNVDVDFRATGPERAGGNIQIWYVKDGQQVVGTSSIYTVEKFDGLALTIDQYAGSGGSIRAFLNDGTTNYRSHHKVDSLSFGHCDYSYRNLGRPSRITLSQIDSGFHVTVDGKGCITSNKVTLPPSYSLGITAAGAELPDSVEIFKILTSGENSSSEKTSQHQETGKHTDPVELKETETSAKLQDQSASLPQNPTDQPVDVNIRLQSMMKQINRVQQVLASSQSQYSSKLDEIVNKLHNIEVKLDSIDLANKNILDVKKDVDYMREDLHRSLEQHVKNLRSDVQETHDSLINTHVSLHGLLSDVGSFTTYAFLTLCGQAILFAGYTLYKRRNRDTTKKFL